MDRLRNQVISAHPSEIIPTREDVQKGLAVGKVRTTRPYFTKFEWTELLAARAQQLKAGAPPLVSLEGLASGPDLEHRIAEKEALQQLLPFIIVRPLPGRDPEYWSAQELRKIH